MKYKVDYSRFSLDQLESIVNEKEKIDEEFLPLLLKELKVREEYKLAKKLESFIDGDDKSVSLDLEIEKETLGLFTSQEYQGYSNQLDRKIIIKNKFREYVQSGLSDKSITHNLKANFGLDDDEISDYFKEIKKEIKFGGVLLNIKFWIKLIGTVIILIIFLINR